MGDALELISNPGRNHIVVEGRWCVEALVESGDFDEITVVRTETAHTDFDEKYLHLAEALILPKATLSELMGFAFHRGIIAVARRPEPRPIAFDKIRGLLVACPELADESNLGAIIRSAAALGAAGILIPKGSGADVYSRKAVRSSSGAVFRIPIYESTDLQGDIASLKTQDFSVVVTSVGEGCLPLPDSPEFENGVVIFGSEQGGLGESWLDLCDVKLSIPMANGMDSLNVAACAAIVLYHFRAKRLTQEA